MAVNTAKVEGRRKVDYKSLREVVDDADRLNSGHVKAIGNWSPWPDLPAPRDCV